MNIVYQLNVAFVVAVTSNIVVRVVVIGAQVDDHEISSGMSFEVPGFWLVSVDLLSSVRCVRSLIPLIELPAWIAPTFLVLQL